MPIDMMREHRLRYRGCFLSFMGDDGVNHPLYVNDINPELSFFGIDQLTKKNVSIPHTMINFDFPELGCINTPNSVLFISKYPLRQYKKGMYRDVLRINNPLEHLTSLAGIKELNINSKELLMSIYNKVYPSPMEAFNFINDHNKLASAFNNKYFFAQSIGHKNPLLWYKNMLIGWAEDGVCYLHPEYHQLFEELSSITSTIKAQQGTS